MGLSWLHTSQNYPVQETAWIRPIVTRLPVMVAKKKIRSCHQLTTRWMVHLITPYSTGTCCYSETWNRRVWTPEWRHGCSKGRAEHAAVLPGAQEEKLQKCNQTTECHFSAGSHKALEPRATSEELSWKEFCNTLEFSSKTTSNLK